MNIFENRLTKVLNSREKRHQQTQYPWRSRVKHWHPFWEWWYLKMTLWMIEFISIKC